MKASSLHRTLAIARVTVALGTIGVACGSCSEQYLARRDSLAVGTGDAVQANIAAQVIDPWPAHAQKTEMATDGQRAQHAVEDYRNPSSTNAPSAAPTSTSVGASGGGVPTTR